MNAITPARELNLKKMIAKARSDIALANPVMFLIRTMNGEDISGETATLREKIDIAKYLASKVVGNADDKMLEGQERAQVPALQIILHGGSASMQSPQVVDVTPEEVARAGVVDEGDETVNSMLKNMETKE